MEAPIMRAAKQIRLQARRAKYHDRVGLPNKYRGNYGAGKRRNKIEIEPNGV